LARWARPALLAALCSSLTDAAEADDAGGIVDAGRVRPSGAAEGGVSVEQSQRYGQGRKGRRDE
jgi:hypothetical protein